MGGSNLIGVSPDAPTVDHRALLEEERTDLLAKLDELGLGGAGLTYDSNFADSSQVTAERGEAEALGASLRETLEDVERALAKLSRRHLRRLRGLWAADRPPAPRGEAGGPVLHQLRRQALIRATR